MQESQPEVELPTRHKQSNLALNERTSNSIVMASEPDQKLPSSQPLSLNQSSKKKASIKDIIKFVIAFAVIVFILVWYWRSPTPAASPQSLMAFSRNIKEGVVELNQTVSKKYAWIKQKVDHFNPSDDRTFFQRILVNTENSNSKSISPVFLFLSHLEPVTSAQKSYLLSKYIEEKRGISLALEMRYFGESRPFYQSDAYSLANLKYLTLQQMVEDVAFAIQRIIDNRFFGISERNKWIINGYHVTGTIAAWVRAKYPTLSAGAIVSGPVLPTPTAPLINQRIYAKVESAGKKCRVIVDKIRQNIQEQLADDSRQALMYGIGQGVQFTAQQILYFYEQRINFIPKRLFIYNCHPSTEAALIADLTNLILGHTIPYDPLSLSQRVMSSVEDWQYFEVVRSARAFWYLRCTQIGLFQTPPTPEKSFASPRVNQTFFRQRCKTIFGVQLWPNSQPLLDMYQPFLASATNLMIMHAYYNVYLPYALNGTNPRTQTIVKRCLQCQELFDYAQYFTMPDEIEDAFAQQRDALQKWLRK